MQMEGSEITEEEKNGGNEKKKIFVAGATGSTGKRIVEQLLAKGFAVKAGARDLDKAKSTFPGDNPDLQIVSIRVFLGAKKFLALLFLSVNRFFLQLGFR